MIDLKILIEYDYTDSFDKNGQEVCLVRLIKFDNKLYWEFLSTMSPYELALKRTIYQTIRIPWIVHVHDWWNFDMKKNSFLAPFEEKHFEWIVD